MNYESIEYEQLGHVARIWHNRPQVSNAQDESLLIELEHAIDRTAQDPEVRVVIIAGRGKHFSAGHDVKEGMANRNHYTTEQRYAWEAKHYYGLSLKIWDHPKPTIAQVQGACIAGGFMTANVCDMIMAADSAFFSEPVIHSMGITSVEVLMHPWVMNHRKAKEFLLTARAAADGDVTASHGGTIILIRRHAPLARDDDALIQARREVTNQL